MGTREDNYVVDDMFAYAGVETTITRVFDDGETYWVECDDGEWYWPDTALMPLSNGERIRNMTDEELAIFLRETVTENGDNLFICHEAGDVCVNDCRGYARFLSWLKSTSKEQ